VAEIAWDEQASLVRQVAFATAPDDPIEEPVARGTVAELVGTFLTLSPERQQDLVLRVATADTLDEWDADTIRELAARDDYPAVAGL
jgi:hypothetical protein